MNNSNLGSKNNSFEPRSLSKSSFDLSENDPLPLFDGEFEINRLIDIFIEVPDMPSLK